MSRNRRLAPAFCQCSRPALAGRRRAPNQSDAAAAAFVRPQGRTRIKPPGDVIKLADRLHYLLQPSLESLLAEGLLAMPCAPFPFQLEGVAFLYPRHAAILADEMGLGKTMQAITAIRLLLRRGEIRRVLLVCPKPLVSNWQREFGLWAPEIPVLVIEGEQARRLWQWQLPDAPVRIANYEVLGRDREALAGVAADGPAAGFDLVVLDESQRDEESRQRHERGRLRAAAKTQLGPDRHARGKQRRRPPGHLRVFGPRLSFAGDEAAAAGPRGRAITSSAARKSRCWTTCRRNSFATRSWS